MTVINCIDGPEFAKRLNKAMGNRLTPRALLGIYHPKHDWLTSSEDIERLPNRTGSSIQWLRKAQDMLLEEEPTPAVLVASGWDRKGECEAVWMWVRDADNPLILKGLTPEAAEEILHEVPQGSHFRGLFKDMQTIPLRISSRLRLEPLRSPRDVAVPLLDSPLRPSGEVRMGRKHAPVVV